MATMHINGGTRRDVSPDGAQTFRRSSGPFAVLGAMVLGLLAFNAAPAHAGPAAGCASSAKAAFARVQLYKDADCKGASVIVGKTGDANRPNFESFRNYDGTLRDIDKSRSSVAIDAGTCVRFFDAADYTGKASTNICAGSGVVFWNLDGFDNRATSMRVCPVSAPAQCTAGSGPAPAPAPPPLAGSQFYMLGTFNMAGGNKERGDKPETTAVALSRSIKRRSADIVFLQEACKDMTDRLDRELGDNWTVTFQATPKWRKPQGRLPADRPPNHKCKTGDGTKEEKESDFGLGIVVRSSRLTVARQHDPYELAPHKGKQARMLCLDIKAIVTQRPLVACSTHLTANPPDKDDTAEIKAAEDSRTLQAEDIKKRLSPYADGQAVLLGGDFNTTPEKKELNALWHPEYGFGAAGSFIEVDSGPNQNTTLYRRLFGRGTWDEGKHKYDYIFVRGVTVKRAEVGHSKFSDHKLLWATVVY